MTLRRLASVVGLALLLVLMQQFAAMHHLAHAIEQLHGLPHAAACDTCVAVVALDSPAVDSPGVIAVSPALVAVRAMAPVSSAIVAARPAAYRSRAPPRLG